MNLRAASLLAALSIIGCSDDATTTPATNDDTGTFEGGPITTRPDDGVDTAPATDTSTAMDTSTATDTATGDSSASDSATADAPAADTGGVKTVNVGAGGNTFSPSAVTIKVGEKVRWVFAGVGHNVVSGTACTADNKFCNPSDASCATAPTAASGATYEHTFTTAGTFPYFCMPHCSFGMIGSVIVTP